MEHQDSSWTLLTNHAHVLVCLTMDCDMRLRDIAARVGITERAVQRIVTELEQSKILSHTREGRRNHYTIHADQPLRHELERDYTVGSLLRAVTGIESST